MIEVIDFYADWCGPCKRLKPILLEIESERPDIKFKYINIDNDLDLATEYSITNLPTVVLLKNGEEVNRFSGVYSKSNIISFLEDIK